MSRFSPELEEFISVAEKVTKNKNYIEDKTGYVITNSKFYENQRHAFSHLLSALALEIEGKPETAVKMGKLYVEAINHLDNLDINGYEYLAGYLLTELRESIEQAGLYINTSTADTLRLEAVRHINRGRDLRPSNKEEAMANFEKSIDLCIKAKTKFSKASKIEIRSYKIKLTSLVVSLIALAVSAVAIVYNIYKS
jgi:hypothetical protein